MTENFKIVFGNGKKFTKINQISKITNNFRYKKNHANQMNRFQITGKNLIYIFQGKIIYVDAIFDKTFLYSIRVQNLL